jgi:ABC-type multidrug transport system fused ATPase/permease subunit
MKKQIEWIWKNLRGIRSRIVLSSGVGVGQICASLFFIWLCKQLIDIATRTADGDMKFFIILLVTTICTEIALSAWRTRLESQTDIRLKNELRYRLFSQLMLSVWNGKERFHSGDAVNRLEEDVRVVADSVCKSLPAVLVTCFQFVAAFLFLTVLNAQLAWIIALIMPVFLLFSRLYVKQMRRLTKDVRTTDSQVQSHIQEKLQHKSLIQSLEQNKSIADKLAFIQSDLYSRVMSQTNFNLFSRTLVMAGFAMGYLIAFVWGVNGIYEGVVSFGMMTAFLQLVGQIQRPMVELSRNIPSLIHAITSAERLQELNDLPVEEQGNPIMLGTQTGIRLENVSFAYSDGDKPVIQNFSFDFTPGSHTAIIGETGIGKSTLIRLMLALLHPQQGKIELYDANCQVEASALTRCNFVYVPQGNSLLSGTIRDNLLLGNPDATEEEVRQVLITAAAEFVYDLPEGLDTLCGERGAGLSEGQAQRICIARGLLRQGNILLLDEFSSSLDKETEQVLMERLMTQTKEKTVIFITHRELISEYCEQIINLTTFP